MTSTGRVWAFGTGAIATAITLLMVLVPASSAAVPHPTTVLVAPYKGTVSAPTFYNAVYGCGTAKAANAKWAAFGGTIHGATTATAKTCKAFAGVGGGGSSSASTGVTVAIPFKVPSSGNHSIASSWTVNLASVQAFSSGGCPLKNVNYNPPLYSYSSGSCQASSYIDWSLNSYLVDTNNNSWFNYNYSYAYAYNDSGWQNSTSCYNYGTPTCSNYTAGFSFAFMGGYNEVGASSFTFSGTSGFTLWSNGTAMVAGHHYALVVSMYLYASSYAFGYNLLAPWAGSASASVNMATLGNGASLNSITIV